MMSNGSSPSADSTTPTRIDTRISRPSTPSGEPPKILVMVPLLMAVSFGVVWSWLMIAP